MGKLLILNQKLRFCEKPYNHKMKKVNFYNLCFFSTTVLSDEDKNVYKYLNLFGEV